MSMLPRSGKKEEKPLSTHFIIFFHRLDLNENKGPLQNLVTEKNGRRGERRREGGKIREYQANPEQEEAEGTKRTRPPKCTSTGGRTNARHRELQNSSQSSRGAGLAAAGAPPLTAAGLLGTALDGGGGGGPDNRSNVSQSVVTTTGG